MKKIQSAHFYCAIKSIWLFLRVDLLQKLNVESIKVMQLFYEQNKISAFKQIFIDQFRFAVETYF